MCMCMCMGVCVCVCTCVWMHVRVFVCVINNLWNNLQQNFVLLLVGINDNKTEMECTPVVFTD